MIVIKQFGLPRSCTNVTEVLIRKNFKCRTYNNFPCWKHGKNTIEGRSLHCLDKNGKKVDTDDLKFIVCTKHPHSWLWSLYDFEKGKPRVKNRTLDVFLRSPKTFHYPETNAIDVFNELTRHWLTMYKDPSIIQQIKNEEIITDQKTMLTRLKDAFNLKMKENDFYLIEKIIKPGLKATRLNFRSKIPRFTKKQIKYINSRLDKEVVKMAGYKL